MARVTNSHNKPKRIKKMREIKTKDAQKELMEIHGKIVYVYGIPDLPEHDREEMLDRLFAQKRELLAIIRKNEN